MHGIPHLGGHDFPQLVFRTTLATIGRRNTRLTNGRDWVINLSQKGEKSMVSRKWVASLPTGEVEAKIIIGKEWEWKRNGTKRNESPMFNVQ